MLFYVEIMAVTSYFGTRWRWW